ncbi:uncharacterized protein LOC142750455 [Rhinoderma darwinii]|uniref:uncharacterized protein LOC142750455 n=1 Tax=Rhinoderma darwinii TaxID=43563 RepID=UPI003F6808AA
MALTKVQVERLIAFVEDHPVIWDKRQEEYKDSLAKEQAWNDVVMSLHPEEWESSTVKERRKLVSNAKARWGTCRDQFRREIVSKGRSGDGHVKKRPYLFTEQLQFLKAVMDIGPTTDNLQEVEVSDAPVVESPSGTPNPEGNTPLPEESASPPARRRRVRRRQEGEGLSSIDSEVLAHLQRRSQDTSEDVFGKMVAQQLKSMPSERHLRCQTTILAVMETFMNNPAPMELCNAVEFHRNRHVMHYSALSSPPPPPPSASSYRGYVPSSQPQFSQDRPACSSSGQFAGGPYGYHQVQGAEKQCTNVAGPSNEDFVCLYFTVVMLVFCNCCLFKVFFVVLHFLLI